MKEGMYIMIKNNEGFTLIELIVIIGIIGLIVPAVSTMIIQGFNIFDRGIEKMSTEQQVEIALREIADYLKASNNLPPLDHEDENNNSITLNNNSDSFSFKSYSDNTNKDIEISLSSADKNLNLLINDRLVAQNIKKIKLVKEKEKIYHFKISYDIDNNIEEKSKIISVKN
ncbi:Type II secretory pathway, pseudopilin PulG [Halanaerobium congolense]|nr:Type II secretory pathway, pseudopilin PulG [Halanaerobium congolense]